MSVISPRIAHVEVDVIYYEAVRVVSETIDDVVTIYDVHGHGRSWRDCVMERVKLPRGSAPDLVNAAVAAAIGRVAAEQFLKDQAEPKP